MHLRQLAACALGCQRDYPPGCRDALSLLLQPHGRASSGCESGIARARPRHAGCALSPAACGRALPTVWLLILEKKRCASRNLCQTMILVYGGIAIEAMVVFPHQAYDDHDTRAKQNLPSRMLGRADTPQEQVESYLCNICNSWPISEVARRGISPQHAYHQCIAASWMTLSDITYQQMPNATVRDMMGERTPPGVCECVCRRNQVALAVQQCAASHAQIMRCFMYASTVARSRGGKWHRLRTVMKLKLL